MRNQIKYNQMDTNNTDKPLDLDCNHTIKSQV